MTTFGVWVADEPEFMRDAEHKFSVLTHPVHMALGTGGKNDALAKEAISALAGWALLKLAAACAKVLWWCVLAIVRRKLGG